MQTINNVFDHTLTVADAATLSLFGPQFYVREDSQRHGLAKNTEQ